jgi:hypothetical protein
MVFFAFAAKGQTVQSSIENNASLHIKGDAFITIVKDKQDQGSLTTKNGVVLHDPNGSIFQKTEKLVSIIKADEDVSSQPVLITQPLKDIQYIYADVSYYTKVSLPSRVQHECHTTSHLKDTSKQSGFAALVYTRDQTRKSNTNVPSVLISTMMKGDGIALSDRRAAQQISSYQLSASSLGYVDHIDSRPPPAV